MRRNLESQAGLRQITGRDGAFHLEHPRKVAERHTFHPQSSERPWRTPVELVRLPTAARPD